jgi:hypothetical protein
MVDKPCLVSEVSLKRGSSIVGWFIIAKMDVFFFGKSYQHGWFRGNPILGNTPNDHNIITGGFLSHGGTLGSHRWDFPQKKTICLLGIPPPMETPWPWRYHGTFFFHQRPFWIHDHQIWKGSSAIWWKTMGYHPKKHL